MASTENRRGIKYLTFYFLVMLFFGISDTTTQFFFPETGAELQRLIMYYFPWVVALMVLIVWMDLSGGVSKLPAIPPLWIVILNFSLFLIPSYLIFVWVFQGHLNTIPIFGFNSFVRETVISFSENLIGLILLPALIPLGKGTGTIASGKILERGKYTVSYAIPNLNRLKYGLYAVFFVSLLHIGSLSRKLNSWNDLISALSITLFMFGIFWFIKETIGFGASEAVHNGWNLALVTLTGAT